MKAARPALLIWRHPRPDGAAGICVGAGTELPVSPRRAKRLARRIQQTARRERLPHRVHCSPLRRCADVARWLRRWGWEMRIEPALRELDFGAWESQPWAAIGKVELDAWVASFAEHRPGGGESLRQMLVRAAAWEVASDDAPAVLAIGHGGWMLARRWLQERGEVLPDAASWPTAPRYAELWRLA